MSTARLLSPEEIAVQAGRQVPFLLFPERAAVFADRELRLRQLAAGHAMRDYLLFVAELARAQHQLLQEAPPLAALPDRAAIDAAAAAGMPLLDALGWPRDAAWREGLKALLTKLESRLAGSPAQAAVNRLATTPPDEIERQADRLLSGVMLSLDLASAPLIAAGLQLHWTRLLLDTQRARGDEPNPPFGRIDDATACPCCGSRPTASITRVGAEASGYRYLHCSLCSLQWHMVRIKCSHCQSTKGISYRSLEALPGHEPPATGAAKDAVQAEVCDECGHYLKIVHMEKDLQVEPVADDLASLTLDLLVSEAGVARHGVNLMLLFGDPDAPPEPGGP
jgi:FdhE protein